jgi:hypothetical protein
MDGGFLPAHIEDASLRMRAIAAALPRVDAVVALTKALARTIAADQSPDARRFYIGAVMEALRRELLPENDRGAPR